VDGEQLDTGGRVDEMGDAFAQKYGTSPCPRASSSMSSFTSSSTWESMIIARSSGRAWPGLCRTTPTASGGSPRTASATSRCCGKTRTVSYAKSIPERGRASRSLNRTGVLLVY
jgi:hypothetical protein